MRETEVRCLTNAGRMETTSGEAVGSAIWTRPIGRKRNRITQGKG